MSPGGSVSPFEIVDAPYAGFEGRPRAATFEDFLTGLSVALHTAIRPGDKVLFYGTGIGGLLALCLRAGGEFHDVPLLLQAPVLWGLERRLMPRVMRFGSARFLLNRLFTWRWFQRRFVRKQFQRQPNPQFQQEFFDGYARCAAAPDFFAWLTPALLRKLEHDFQAQPEALAKIGVWWGGRDQVVSTQEFEWTARALKVCWPMREFPRWGHYPMIDEPADWVRALSDVLENPESVPGPRGPQAG